MNIWNWMRSCARCSAYFPPIDLLCESCWKVLWAQSFPQTRSLFEGALLVQSFWDWKGESDDIGELIKKRKRGAFHQAHLRMAQNILRGEAHPFLSAKTIVYPSKNPLVRDHTASLAEAFAQLLYLPAVAVEISQDPHYKVRGQKARLASRRAGRFMAKSVQHPIVFVDDVLTTGATARAVWRALGKPREFRVFVLTYKTLGKRRFQTT